MTKNKWFFLLVLSAVMFSASGLARAEDISVTIRKQIKQIAKLGTNPKATEADKKQMTELYQKVREQGMNAVPVLEEVLRSKGNTAEKKASLYLITQIYYPTKPEEMDHKGGLMIRYLKIGLTDESEEVRGLALQMICGIWHADTYPTVLEFFKTSKHSGERVYALSKIAGYQTEASYAVVVSALSDPDPEVQKAAVKYKAYRDDLKVKAAEISAQAERKKSGESSKGYGKNAH